MSSLGDRYAMIKRKISFGSVEMFIFTFDDGMELR
jgi:uncharacterized protein YfkK (UPF0435 family)